MRKVLIHLFHHFILGLAVGLFNWWLMKSFWLGILGMMVNIFIDLDHLIEYLVFSRRFRLREFLSGAHFEEKKKIFVVFHGWEYVILCFILWILTTRSVFLVLGIAIGTHLLFDQLTYELSPWTYFVTYRLKNKFAIKKICLDQKK
jgi:hypothetical protein